MTPALHPYPAYKPSDVLWLGNVPEHWEVSRLKGYVTNAIDLTGAPLEGELYLALEHVEGWTGRCSDAGDGVSTSSQVKRFQAQDVLFGKLRPYLAKVTCPKRNGVCVGESDRTHPVGAGLKPNIARGVGAGLKPASTTKPHTAEDWLHLCECATIHTTRGAADGVSTSSQVKRFLAQDVLFGRLRPILAKVTCPKRNGVCVGESDRTHPVGAGFKPAPTTTPHTADDRLHLCENATIHTTRGAGNGVSTSSQVKRFLAQDVLFGKLRPYLAKVTCPKRNGVCVGESDRTHPVGAGLKPAPTTTPHTADDRLHLYQNATNHITRGATNRQ